MALSTQIELNPEFVAALDRMEHSGDNLFITGRAGTGKSTLLEYFRLHTKKNIAVLAPTGVAAVNVRGQTIHSFFKWKPDITLAGVKRSKESRLYKKLEAIVIDEISMVRADLLDCIDKFLRLNGRDRNAPFGGIQMIMIGDLFQLPPVVRSDELASFLNHYESPYFFSAKVLSQKTLGLGNEKNGLVFLELEKIYRQRDAAFIDLLNAVRGNEVGERELALLNSRLQKDHATQTDDYTMYLTTRNDMAAAVNEAALATLKTGGRKYKGVRKGKFDDKYLPTEMDLSVKIGAQVMMLTNDTSGKWVNGTVGKVIGFEKDKSMDADAVLIKLRDGETVVVGPHQWDIYEFKFDVNADHVDAEPVGSFTQYPFRLAWAVTIHKSQGKTFDRVVIDIGSGTFSPGQLYVALSRCTTLEGIILKREVMRHHVMTDPHVVTFMRSFDRVALQAA